MTTIILPSTPGPRPKMVLISSGWKSSPTPPKADLYLDCRGIPNPFHQVKLDGKDGDHEDVIQWVRMNGSNQIAAMETIIGEGLAQIPTRRRGEALPLSRPYVICMMCAHGVHRSRAVKHILDMRLRDAGFEVEVK